jgi:hypothetical protein
LLLPVLCINAVCLQVLDAIEDTMPPETPLAFGLHPNAEIGFKLREAETFCNSLVQLQPRESGGERRLPLLTLVQPASAALESATDLLAYACSPCVCATSWFASITRNT